MESKSNLSLQNCYNKIHIFGASGSGVSTLGKLLSQAWKIPVFDFDDYYWADSEIPFSVNHNNYQIKGFLKSQN